MEIFRKFLRKITLFRRSKESSYEEFTPEEKIRRCLQPYKRFLYKINDIIVWESPKESVKAILAMNIIFWLLIQYQWRFYGVVFSIIALILTHEVWNLHIWPEVRVESIMKQKDENFEERKEPEISVYLCHFCLFLEEQIRRMKSLRETQPMFFCGLMSFSFLVLAGVGQLISGLILLYLICMLFLTIPGLFIHVVPMERKKQMLHICITIQSVLKPTDSSVNVDEYLPESSRENLEVFAEAVNLNGDTNGSSQSSLSHLETMPSHEATLLGSEDDPFSLDPRRESSPPPSSTSSSTPSDFSLRFEATHFNGQQPMDVNEEASSRSQTGAGHRKGDSSPDSSEFEIIEPDDITSI